MFEVPLILAMHVSGYIRNQTNSKGCNKAINHVSDNIGILSLPLSLSPHYEWDDPDVQNALLTHY